MGWVFISRNEDGGTLYQHDFDDWIYLVVYKKRTVYEWYVYENVENGFSSPFTTTSRLQTINTVFKKAEDIAASWRNRF